MKNNDIKIYQTAVSELKTCNAKAELDKKAGKTPDTCAMTDNQKAAYQRLINNNAIVEAVKSATQQVNQTTASATSTNATDATSSSSSSSSTTTHKNLSCYDGTVLSGSGKCCPTATPIYDSNSGVCVTSTTTSQKKSSSSNDDNKNAMLLALLGSGALGGSNDSSGGGAAGNTHSDEGRTAEKGSQYSFNYSIQQDEKGSPITYLPINSDDIKFIVFKSSKMNDLYKSVVAQAQKANSNGKPVIKEKLSIKVPAVFGMNDNEPSVIHYIEVPLEFNKWRELFKDDLKAGIQWNYQNYTNLLRVSAETVNQKVFLATVVYQVSDNLGHSKIYQFYVPFDFTGTSTRIGAMLDTKKADIEISPVNVDDKQVLSMSGTVTESVFQDGKCTMKISGTVSDDKTQETLENQTLPYTAATGTLNEADCNKLKDSSIAVKGAKITDSALSNGTILSDQIGVKSSTGSNVVSKNQVITINGATVTADVLVDPTTGKTYTNLSEEQKEYLRKTAGDSFEEIQTCYDYDVSVCKVNPDGSKEDISSNTNKFRPDSTLYISTGNDSDYGNKTTITEVNEKNDSIMKSVTTTAKEIAAGFEKISNIPRLMSINGDEATVMVGNSLMKIKIAMSAK